MERHLRRLGLLFLLLAATESLSAQEKKSVDLARTIPLADVHMHLNAGHAADHYRGLMDKANVRWGGGVGGGRDDHPLDVKSSLGPRYIAALGQSEFFGVLFTVGERGLYDPDQALFQRLFASAPAAFKNGSVRGFGEIHINNVSPFTPARGQRRIDLESPVVLKMFDLASRHNGFMQIHTMSNSGPEEILRVSAKYPNVSLVLSHCLPGASPQQLESLLRARANLYCELSAQGPMHRIERVYGTNGVREEWRSLIERQATRFMVGSDACCGLENRYEEIIQEIRTYLLPAFTEKTIRRIAFENAKQVFHLQ
jgi:hypothetical protein